MNTHQKAFFAVAVSLGCAAAAFSATPAPSVAVAAPIDLPRATVIGHRMVAPEITLEHTLVLGHRTDSMVASRTSKTASVG